MLTFLLRFFFHFGKTESGRGLSTSLREKILFPKQKFQVQNRARKLVFENFLSPKLHIKKNSL